MNSMRSAVVAGVIAASTIVDAQQQPTPLQRVKASIERTTRSVNAT